MTRLWSKVLGSLHRPDKMLIQLIRYDRRKNCSEVLIKVIILLKSKLVNVSTHLIIYSQLLVNVTYENWAPYDLTSVPFAWPVI